MLFAQGDLPGEADKKFKAGNYDGALLDYLKLMETDNKNDLYNLRTAICYLQTYIDKAKSIPFLEFMVNRPNPTPEAQYYYSIALAYSGKNEAAIQAFNKLLASALPPGIDQEEIKLRIKWAENARDLMRAPVAVTFENLGPSVNSPFADYAPFISSNESFLMFNSRRPDNSKLLEDGRYASNVYISEVSNGKWQKPVDIGPNVNTSDLNEEIVGVCADGNTLIFSLESPEIKGDIMVGPKFEKEILKPFKVGSTINSSFFESAATISPDGRTMYFASNREGGMGGFDIYRSKILPNGEWGEAYNLGPDFNTPLDDNFPIVSLDGKSLYFSSKGHNSMGGYDIFQSEILEDEVTFGPVKNIGFPINTTMDDQNLCMSERGRYGYLATIRKDSKGDLDIYRVTFKGIDSELSIIKGTVKSQITEKNFEACTIEVIDSKSNDTFGQYKVNSATGRYAIILPPGEYDIIIDAPGFKQASERVKVLDKASFQTVIEKYFVIQPK